MLNPLSMCEAVYFSRIITVKRHANVAHMNSGDYFTPKNWPGVQMDANCNGDQQIPSLSFGMNFNFFCDQVHIANENKVPTL